VQGLAETADSGGMARLSLCGAGMLLASAIVFAQVPNGGGPGPVLGIVEIPEMFSLDPNTGERAPRGALTIYTRPDSESKALPQITSPEAIDDAEYGYEEAGAIVYGRERGYFLVRTSRGVGWLSPHNAGSFHSFETLITDSLTHLTDAWDGFVSASPGSAKRTRVPDRRPYGSESVRVKALQTVDGKLWADIEVISHTLCESDKPITIKARGWIPAHDNVGAPTVWFSSRGC
jgi:hypothetical protein